jgi:Tol biopolymer transport system component
MGKVYRGTDTNLKRAVALKVLPQVVATDPERVVHLQREAQVLASLNHPNIAQIYGLEKTGMTAALVMELVEGPTLAERIAAGPIPIEETLSIATQVVDALEASHRQGIVHRDLKPSNIKVREDGTVKVLDFGLAKAGTEDLPGAEKTTVALTRPETVVGTVAYMSPEQTRGRVVSKQADIWAFGVVLYEMLAGKRAFRGASTSDLIVAVMTEEPDWSALPASTPWLVTRLLRRCLNKDPALRLGDIRDARWDLADSGTTPHAPPGATFSRLHGWWTVVSVAFIGITAGAVLSVLSFRAGTPQPIVSPDTPTLAIVIDEPWQYLPNSSGGVAISPDGHTAVYAATDGRQRRLFVRRLDQAAPVALHDTADGVGPVFSPDGNWVAFSTDTALKKVPTNGGIAFTVTQLRAPTRGMFWARDNQIYFALSIPGGIYRVDAAGGPIVSVTSVSEGEMFHRSPWLTEAGALLYVSQPPFEDGVIYEQPLARGVRTVLLSGASGGRLTHFGQFVFMRQNDLFFVPNGLSQSISFADARPLARRVAQTIGGGDYAFSNTGRLVYASAASQPTVADLVWVSRTGEVANTALDPRPYEGVGLSPDGTRAVVHVGGGAYGYLAVHDFRTGTTRRLTVQGNNSHPVWSPDGAAIVYRSMRPPEPEGRVLRQTTDGRDEPHIVIRGATATDHYQPSSWSGDGQILLAENIDGTFHALAEGNRTSQIPAIGENLRTPRISWDGRWLAYVSSDGGTPRVYVQPYPSLKGRWLVSPDGGIAPRWSRDGSRLFFMMGTKMMEVSVRTIPSFNVSEPRALFEGNYSSNYDVTADGTRFLMTRAARRDPIRHLTVVLDSLETRQ